MCLYPRLIKNKKYTATKKNGGNIPHFADNRVLAIPVGCNKCMECMKKKSREWKVRLLEEVRQDSHGRFVTLTFSTESYEELKRQIEKETRGYGTDNEVCRIGVRRFLERWRKKHGKSVKHWLITEIGGERYEAVHIHGVIWSKNDEDIRNIWKYGFVYIGNELSEKTANYVTKYLTKRDKKHKEYVGKIMTSAGIGKGYTERRDSNNNKYIKNKTDESYTDRRGVKASLPIYYRNKIYTDKEREELWIEKLNKEERWVNGMKIDISKSMENYWKALKGAREKNKRLGYGNADKDWQRIEYENARREMLQQNRANREEIVKEYKPKELIKMDTKDDIW